MAPAAAFDTAVLIVTTPLDAVVAVATRVGATIDGSVANADVRMPISPGLVGATGTGRGAGTIAIGADSAGALTGTAGAGSETGAPPPPPRPETRRGGRQRRRPAAPACRAQGPPEARRGAGAPPRPRRRPRQCAAQPPRPANRRVCHSSCQAQPRRVTRPPAADIINSSFPRGLESRGRGSWSRQISFLA